MGGWGGVGLLTFLVFVLHDLRSDRLFYFVAHTSCYVDYFGVGGGVGLSTSLVFVLHDLLCVGYVFSASLHTLHVTLLHHSQNGEQVGMKENQLLALRFDHTHSNMTIVKM